MAEGRRTINADIEKFLSSGKYKYKINEPLSKHTTLGIGGDASFFVEVDREEQLISLLKFVNENKIKFYVLGGGTNVLFSDEGFEGIIIKLSSMYNVQCTMYNERQTTTTLDCHARHKSCLARNDGNGETAEDWKIGRLEDWQRQTTKSKEEFNEHRSPTATFGDDTAMRLTTIEVSASDNLASVARQTAEEGLSGLEYFAGIPGTVGGAIFGNAGIKNHSISDNLIKIEIVDFDGNKKILDKKNINFEYRKSGISNCVITRAFFQLKKSDKNAILNVISQELEKRKKTQPIGTKNAGCIFKNPQNDSAGRLIDSLNLKNYNIGDIEISSKHANFFINRNNGTAGDMLRMIEFVKKEIFEKYNIELEPEIRIVK